MYGLLDVIEEIICNRYPSVLWCCCLGDRHWER